MNDVQIMEIEETVIGCMLLSENCAIDAIAQLKPQDFYFDDTIEIFNACVNVFVSNSKIDVQTVIAQLKTQGAIDFAIRCASKVPSLSNFHTYRDLLLEQSRVRELSEAILRSQAAVAEGESSIQIEKNLLAVLQKSREQKDTISAYDAVLNTLSEIEENRQSGIATGITTGFYTLDLMLGKLQKKSYVVVGARSGMGKTALAIHMARKAATSGNKVLFISLEMPAEGSGGLATRILAQEAVIDHDTIRFGRYNGKDKLILEQQAKKGYLKNITICEQAKLTTMQIQSLIRRKKPDVVYIDYLGLIKGTKADSKRVEVDEISHDLKNIAKICDVPIVALVQLNREAVGEKTKPSLAHIRDSDAITHDADAVLLLHREHYYNPNAEKRRGIISIAKNRQGKCGDVPVAWYGEYMLFDTIYEDGGIRPEPNKPTLDTNAYITNDFEEI